MLSRLHRVRQAGRTLTLAALLLPQSLPLATPVYADHNPLHEPVARLQLLVNSVHIYDDNDGFLAGDGEIELTAVVLRCTDYHLGQCDGSTVLASDTFKFSAGNGEDETIGKVVPATGSVPVYVGVEYMLRIMALERDSVSADEHMGEWVWPIIQGENWHIGSHEYRSWGDYYDNGTRRHQGDFSVAYEIRPIRFLICTRLRSRS
jgi:hypothetical protein